MCVCVCGVYIHVHTHMYIFSMNWQYICTTDGHTKLLALPDTPFPSIPTCNAPKWKHFTPLAVWEPINSAQEEAVSGTLCRVELYSALRSYSK